MSMIGHREANAPTAEQLSPIRHLLPTGRLDDGTLVFPDGVEPYYIRTSERGSFKKCRVYWDFNSQNRYSLEPVRQNDALTFGIAVHKGLEPIYNPETWHYPIDVRINLAMVAFVEALEEAMKKEADAQGGAVDHDRKLEYDEMLTLGVGMLKQYGQWSVKHDKGWTPIAVEKRYQLLVCDENGVPLIVNDRPVVYQLRVDLLAEDEHGRLWIWDHKTTGRLDDLGFLDVDTQLSAYPWALSRILGKYVHGVIYNELVKSIPHPPKVLTKGNLSVDKRQNTTYELYLSAIDEHGLDRADYEGMLEYLRTNPTDYFRRTPVLRSPAELDYQGTLVLHEARDMLVGPSGDGPYIYPNAHKFNCNKCAFRGPCTVRSELGDYEFMLNDPKLFRKREVGDPTVEESV